MHLKENKIFHKMLASYVISLFGASFFTIALNLFVLQTTKSAKAMSVIFVTQIIVSVLFGSIAGTVVDKFNRKTIMWVSEFARGILMLAMAYLFSFDKIPFVLVVTLCAVITFITLFHMPAYMSSLNDVTGVENAGRTTAINNLGDNIARITGLALGGGFVGLFGGEGAILFNAITAFISGLIMLCIKDFPNPNQKEKHLDMTSDQKGNSSFWRDMKEGFVFVWRNPIARSSLFFMPITFSFFSTCLMLIQVIAVKDWNARGWEYGLIESFIPLGYILGTMVIYKKDKQFRKRGRYISSGLLSLGVLYILLSFATENYVYLPLILIIGFVFCFPSLLMFIIGREEIDSSIQGRVFGTIGSITSVLPALLVTLSSYYADIYGGLIILRGCGIILLILSIILIITLRNIREYD